MDCEDILSTDYILMTASCSSFRTSLPFCKRSFNVAWTENSKTPLNACFEMADEQPSCNCWFWSQQSVYMASNGKRKCKHWLNPLTPRTFCKKCIFWTFWWFLGWISAKLPFIWWKMRLQHSSLPFLPPASRFSALWLRHAQKSKFWDGFWMRKWPTSLGFSIFWIFFFRLSFFSFSLLFCCSD